MPEFDLNNEIQKAEDDNYYNSLCFHGHSVKIEKVSKTRSARQNRALHKYFSIISKTLNSLGRTFEYKGLTGKSLSMPYTPDIVKNYVWRPLQKEWFNKESTTKLTTEEINKMIDVFTLHFGNQGIVINFPSIESLLIEHYNKEGR